MVLDEVTKLRRMVDEPQEGSPYTDAELQERLDAADSTEAAARDIWQEKMAAAASLANISEGGSSRSNSQVFDQYKKMWELYRDLAASGASGGNNTSPVLRKITRV